MRGRQSCGASFKFIVYPRLLAVFRALFCNYRALFCNYRRYHRTPPHEPTATLSGDSTPSHQSQITPNRTRAHRSQTTTYLETCGLQFELSKVILSAQHRGRGCTSRAVRAPKLATAARQGSPDGHKYAPLLSEPRHIQPSECLRRCACESRCCAVQAHESCFKLFQHSCMRGLVAGTDLLQGRGVVGVVGVTTTCRCKDKHIYMHSHISAFACGRGHC